MKIAITGIIGSGKSTFASILHEEFPNYDLVSMDAFQASCYDDSAFRYYLRGMFGTDDKSKISDLVFSDRKHLILLNSLAAPAVYRKLEDALATAQNIIVEFPLLFESGWRLKDFDVLITVVRSEDECVDAVIERNGFSREKVLSIIGTQHSQDIKSLMSDFVVRNTSLDDMKRQTKIIAHSVKAKSLEQRFLNDFSNRELWEIYKNEMTRSGRYYHSLAHVENMFRHYDEHQHLITSKFGVRLAIWFHDFSYSTTGCGFNEQDSIEKMARLLRSKAPSSLDVGAELTSVLYGNAAREIQSPIGLAAELIMSTVHHKPTPFFSAKTEFLPDCQMFLDFDLSVFASPYSVFEEYDRQVRQEHIHVPEDTFIESRIRVLRTFEARERIFLSSAFSGLEKTARYNIERIINLWERVYHEKGYGRRVI